MTKAPLCYLHLPKCAGQSIQNLLSLNYRPKEILQTPSLSASDLETYAKQAKIKVIIGHFNRSTMHVIINSDVPKAVILREPNARVISYYNYLRTKQSGKMAEIAKQLTLGQFVEHKSSIEARNGVTRRLAGTGSREPNMSDLMVAYDQLSKFQIVGVQESLYIAAAALARDLRLRTPLLRHLNMSVDREISDIDKCILYQHNILDTRLYSNAKNLAEKLITPLNTRLAKRIEQFSLEFSDLENRFMTSSETNYNH
jgi:hypothetical protein